MVQYEKKKAMVFVDVRNILKAVESDKAYCMVDFHDIVSILCREYDLIRVYAYDGSLMINGIDQTEGFHRYLKECRFTLRTRPVKIRDSENSTDAEQKGVDVELACDMMTFAIKDCYDVAILISGDGDFIPVVERVKDQGKIVEVASFCYDTISNDLRLSADRFHNLDSIPILRMRPSSLDEEVDA